MKNTLILVCLMAIGNLVKAQIITTVAGNGSFGYIGDGGAATVAQLNAPVSVAIDAGGNFYIADNQNNVVRKVSPGGIIRTVAGNGTAGYSGDGGPAIAAKLNRPSGVALDGSGNLYIAEIENNVVRKVTVSGIISTVAGHYTGTLGAYSGDGAAATIADLSGPTHIAIDGSGNLYIADLFNNVIRKVNTAGIISTVAGNYYGSLGSYSGDGGSATNAYIHGPDGVAVDAIGNIYIADEQNNVIRKVNTAGIISTIAGNHALGGGYNGDGVAATAAQMYFPDGIACDGSGNLYITDRVNNRIRMVNSLGIISTIAGIGFSSSFGDGGPATDAGLNNPSDVSLDGMGNLYIADANNYTIRKIICMTTPEAGIISGPSSVCTYHSISLTETAHGGTWSSSGSATIGSTGVLTGVSAGTASITYTVVSACGTSSTVKNVIINPTPSAGIVTGPDSVCIGTGNEITLTDTATGGTWSAANSNAHVSGTGLVTGVTTGTNIISYTVTNGYCTSTAQKTIYVHECNTGVDEINQTSKEVWIYPNPTEKTLNIASNTVIIKIALCDITGRELMTSNYSGTNVEINISALANGVYWCKVNDRYYYKIIKW